MADTPELTEEDVFLNDVDPIDAIREIRREEGVAEEDLPISDTASNVPEPEDKPDGQDELDNLQTDNRKPADDSDKDKKTEPEKDDDGKTAPDDDDTKKADEAAGDDGTVKPVKPAVEGEEDPAKAEPGTDTPEKELPQTLKFKANGQDFEFTQEEVAAQFETVFGQAMDYTKKMQKIAPYRKMISALEAEGVSQDQLNLALSAIKGDSGALRKIIEDNKIDSFDITSEDDDSPKYDAKDYGKSDIQMDIEEVTSKIQSDPEYKITVDVIDQQWDEPSRLKIADNPRMIMGLHNDIKSGLYDKVSPAAMKMKVLDGNTKSDIEYYMLAGEQFRQAALADQGQKDVDKLNKNTQDVEDEFEGASSEAERKRAATSTGARADRKGVIDYLDDDDEAYNAWYKKLNANI